MLKLTTANRNAFAVERKGHFEAELRAKLRRFFPGLTDGLSEEELERICQESCERGRSHGLRGARQLSLFAGLELGFGPDFLETQAWARAARLDPRGTTPEARLGLLWDAGRVELARRRMEYERT